MRSYEMCGGRFVDVVVAHASIEKLQSNVMPPIEMSVASMGLYAMKESVVCYCSKYSISPVLMVDVFRKIARAWATMR